MGTTIINESLYTITVSRFSFFAVQFKIGIYVLGNAHIYKEVSPTLTALQVLCFTCSHVYLPCGWLCQRLVLFVLYLPLNFLFAASTQSLLANTQNVLSALASVILGIFEGAGVLILLGPGPVRIAFLGAHCHCFQKEKHSQ